MERSKFRNYWSTSIVILLLITSCSTNNKFKVGFMIPTSTKERYPKERDYFTAKINESGGEVISTDAQNDDKLQIIQADSLINLGIKVLVIIAVNKNTASVIVRRAHQHKIKVIAYERIIVNSDLDYFISFDNVKIGELLASYAVKQKPEGNYFLMGGDYEDQNAIWLKKGIMNILTPLIKSNKINLAYDVFIESWGADNASMELRNYMRLTNAVPDVILSCSDAMSNASIKVLEQNHVDPSQFPLITGQNGELQAIKNIISGKQTMTIYKPIKKEAEEAANLAIKLAKNEKITEMNKTSTVGKIEIPSILLEPIIVDKNNIKSTVIADGAFTEAQIYN